MESSQIRRIFNGHCLLIPGFRLHPFGLGIHDLLIQRRQFLGRDFFRIAGKISDDLILLLVHQQRILIFFHFFAFIIDPLAQPFYRILGSDSAWFPVSDQYSF